MGSLYLDSRTATPAACFYTPTGTYAELYGGDSDSSGTEMSPVSGHGSHGRERYHTWNEAMLYDKIIEEKWQDDYELMTANNEKDNTMRFVCCIL